MTKEGILNTGSAKNICTTFGDSSTRNMISHLHSKHGITKDNETHTINQKYNKESNGNQGYMECVENIAFNEDIFKRLLITMITSHNLSFRIVESAAFRNFSRYLLSCVRIH